MSNGFVQVPKDILEDENLNIYDFKVLCYLISCTNEHRDGLKIAFPSYEGISKKIKVSLSSVKRSISNLINLGYIDNINKKKTRENSKYPTNHYIINLEKKPNAELIQQRKVYSKVKSNQIKQGLSNSISEKNIQVINESIDKTDGNKDIMFPQNIDKPEVSSHRPEPMFPQNLKVCSDRTTNNNYITILNNNIKEQKIENLESEEEEINYKSSYILNLEKETGQVFRPLDELKREFNKKNNCISITE